MKFERVFFCLAILLLAQSVNGGKTIMDTVNNLESLLDKRKSLYDELAKRTTNAHGVYTRDKYGIDKHLTALTDQVDNINTIRKEDTSTAQEERVINEAMRNFFSRDSGLERRRIRSLGKLRGKRCWWCPYILKSAKKPDKPLKAGKSSEDCIS